MAALATSDLSDATGAAPAGASVSASDTFEIGSGSNIVLHYRNTSAQALTLTLIVPGNGPYGVAYADPTYTLAATNGELFIPVRKSADPGDGSNRGTITATGTLTAGQTVRVLRHS